MTNKANRFSGEFGFECVRNKYERQNKFKKRAEGEYYALLKSKTTDMLKPKSNEMLIAKCPLKTLFGHTVYTYVLGKVNTKKKLTYKYVELELVFKIKD